MRTRIEFLAAGKVTSPAGFRAGATFAGIKAKAATGLDLAVLISDQPCNTAGIFTLNRIKAAPVLLSQERLKKGAVQGVVVNSGCANACTGEGGLEDARAMADMTAQLFGLPAESVLPASTGIIGQRLPMRDIEKGIGQIALSPDGGVYFSKAIMTTDTVPKEAAVRLIGKDFKFTIGGAAKGSGMIHPNMGTMLCFLTTDAAVDADFLRWVLGQAADVSLNMVTVDGETSTNDTMLIMANGAVGNEPIVEDSELALPFKEALEQLCIYLARSIARDGEGATKLIEVTVRDAATIKDARMVARAVAGSPLVKAAIHGNDPNWGRVLAAAGRSGVNIKEAKITLFMGNNCVFRNGMPQNFNSVKASDDLNKKEVNIEIRLNQGEATATAWGCDLSEEYVKINAEYTT